MEKTNDIIFEEILEVLIKYENFINQLKFSNRKNLIDGFILCDSLANDFSTVPLLF